MTLPPPSNHPVTADPFAHTGRLLSLIIYSPGLWLTYHLFSLGRSHAPDSVILAQFYLHRSRFYMAFVVLLVFLGLLIILRVNFKQSSLVSRLIPSVILSLVLVTFSYALSGFLLDTFPGT